MNKVLTKKKQRLQIFDNTMIQYPLSPSINNNKN